MCIISLCAGSHRKTPAQSSSESVDYTGSFVPVSDYRMRVMSKPTSELAEITVYLNACVGLSHPEARIDEVHMVSVSRSTVGYRQPACCLP